MSITTAAGGVLSRLDLDGVELRSADDPRWLVDARRDALAWVAEHGFPTRKDEDWKYTKLAPILDRPFEPAPAAVGTRVSAALLRARGPELGGARLVFVNGHLRADLSSIDGLAAGAVVCGLATALLAHPEQLEPILSRPAGRRHGFAAFNDVLAVDGAFIHLAAGVSVSEPIHLVFISDTDGAALLSSPRCVVLAEAGSRAHIVETHFGFDGDVHCTNSVTNVVLGEDAHVEHDKVQDEPETAFHLGLLDIQQGRGSRFISRSIMLGARIARQEVRVGLVEPDAEVSLDGLYLPHGEQVHDNTIFVDHAAINCTSNQLYKGVLDGRGHGIFNGHIMVRPGADGTDANQKNKNLNLSDRAEADTRPRLEIYTDDVKCTHGAAVGQLDEHALLYLRSRGLTESGARALLVYGFIHEMLDRIGLVPLREHVQTLLERRSAGVQ
ncbi:MAG: Fe-S cluster assembly protein SufD [Jatrophihabitantaceae bacterium]